MSTAQLLSYPLTREKILASCHGFTSAGSIRPSGGAPALGETTDTIGASSCFVGAAACLLFHNRGNTPATTARISSVTPMRSMRNPRFAKGGLWDPSLNPVKKTLLIVAPFISHISLGCEVGRSQSWIWFIGF